MPSKLLEASHACSFTKVKFLHEHFIRKLDFISGLVNVWMVPYLIPCGLNMIVSWSSFTSSPSNHDMVQLNSHLKIFFPKNNSFWECSLIWEFSEVYPLKWERGGLEVCLCSSKVILSYWVGPNTLFMQGVCGQDIQVEAKTSKVQIYWPYSLAYPSRWLCT